MPETRASRAANKAPKSATPSATKRKAADDTSPVASKKTKPVKANGATKSKPKSGGLLPELKETKTKKAEKETAEVAEQSDDGEGDEANALAQVIDSDDEEAPVNEKADFKEGQDVGKIPAPSKDVVEASKSTGGVEPGVVYIGRIPHGFYEQEMRQYFSQFGTINKLRMSRSKSTGASKHFGFIEFEEYTTAEIAAKTMDNYLLFGHILKCKVVPKSQIHDSLWKGANKRFKKIPWNKMAGNKLKKPLTESGWSKKIEKEEQKRAARSAKLAEIGYDFDQPALKGTDNASAMAIDGDEQPKALEAPPEVQEDKENEEEPATKKPAAKAGKKGKGGKGKKAKA